VVASPEAAGREGQHALSDAAPKPRSKLASALKAVVAVAILALVARVVPWNDELRYESGGEKRTYPGRIDGDWKAERVHFVFDPPVPAAELPEPWRASGAESLIEIDATRSETTGWQPGMPRVFRDVEAEGLALALALALLGIVATALRWWRLLDAAGCRARFFDAVRLSFIGFFFNIVVPGLTGGDLVKAVLIARSHPERRAAAALSVLVDRLIGVLVLVAMGAVAIVLQGERFPYPRAPLFAGLAVAVAGALAYVNPTLRRAIGFERWIGRLPFSGALKQIDEAITVYSRRPREMAFALGFSLLNQCCVMAALVALGRSFGDATLSIEQYVVVGAVGNLASAVPITPGGVGVTEVIYGELSRSLGGSWTIGFAVSVAWRLCMVSIGLFGGLFLLLPSSRISDAERAELRSATH
jgi:uncharacterized protein (TIRG00374 family)